MSKQAQVSPRTTGLKYAFRLCPSADLLWMMMGGSLALPRRPSTDLAAAIRAGDDARVLQLLATGLPPTDPASADQAARL